MDDSRVTCARCTGSFDPATWYCPYDGTLLLLGRDVGGEWRLEEKLGQGMMGAVFRARHRIDDRLAAVKILGPRVVDDATDVEVQRFVRESMARVRHPNCVEIHDVGRLQGTPGAGTAIWWIRMEYVVGTTLEPFVVGPAPMPWPQFLPLATQMCAGLGACHAAGIVHRDFKPANVMVETVTGHPKVADFGLARVDNAPRLTASGTLLGTLLYMSPEVLRGERGDEPADLYALGVVLYQLMSGGGHPFLPPGDANGMVLMRRVLLEDPTPLSLPPGLYPPGLAGVTMRLLEKQPENRFGSAVAVREAILDLVPVDVRVVNRELEIDVVVASERELRLREVRGRAIEASIALSPLARRILASPDTRFGWRLGDQPMADLDTVRHAAALVPEARPIELHLRVFPPDVLLGG